MNSKILRLAMMIVFFLSMVIDIDEADARRRRRFRPRRAPTLSPEVDLVVTYGDRVTIFQMVKDKKNFYMHYFNSLGQKKDLALSKSNYQFLISQAGSVKGGDSIDECPRNHVSVETKNGSKVRACLDADTPTSKKLVDLANVYSSVL